MSDHQHSDDRYKPRATPEGLASMELDARVAREVMGWPVERLTSGRIPAFGPACYILGPPVEWLHLVPVPDVDGMPWSPSRTIEDAWQVAEKLGILVSPTLVRGLNGYTNWGAGVFKGCTGHPDGGQRYVVPGTWAEAETAPLAICLAALAAVKGICTWHGPEGDTCEAPATSGELCTKHRALVEMLQEPPRSACNEEETGVRVRYSGTHEFEAGGPIAPGSRVMVDSRGRLVTWDRDGWAVGATIQEPAGRAEKAGDIVVVYLFETPTPPRD